MASVKIKYGNKELQNGSISAGQTAVLNVANYLMTENLTVEVPEALAEVSLGSSNTITPTKAEQNITPAKQGLDYDGFSSVTVAKIPDEYIIPTGTKKLTADDIGSSSIDVAEFQYAQLDISIWDPDADDAISTNIITFTVQGVVRTASNGATWAEVRIPNEPNDIYDVNGSTVNETDLVVANADYYYSQPMADIQYGTIMIDTVSFVVSDQTWTDQMSSNLRISSHLTKCSHGAINYDSKPLYLYNAGSSSTTEQTALDKVQLNATYTTSPTTGA